MSETFTGAQLPDIKRITLGGTDVLTEINIGTSARLVSLRFEVNPGKYAWVGDDAQAIGTDYMTVTAETLHQISMQEGVRQPTRRDRIYVSGNTPGTVVQVQVEG